MPLTFPSDLADPHRNPYHLLGSIHALASGHGAATQEKQGHCVIKAVML